MRRYTRSFHLSPRVNDTHHAFTLQIRLDDVPRDCTLSGNRAHKIDVNCDVVVCLPKQEARILQSPLNIRHHKVSLCSCAGAIEMYQHGDGDFMRRAQQREDACYLDGRVA